MVHRFLEEEPAPPGQLRPDCSSELVAACLRCLRKDPEERYPSAADPAEDLDRMRSGPVK